MQTGKQLKEAYAGDEFVTKIRDKEIRTALTTTSLSGLKIPKVALPKFKDYGEILRWVYQENVPGSFRIRQAYFRLNAKGKIRNVNLREKEHLNGRIAASTIYQKMTMRNAYRRHLTP